MNSSSGINWSKLLAHPARTKAIDPYFVWADMTRFAGYFSTPPTHTTEVPFLLESTKPSTMPFDTKTVKLRNVLSALVRANTVTRWQMGKARTGSLTFRTLDVTRARAQVVAAVLDDGCPLFNHAYSPSSTSVDPSCVKWLWHQGRTPGRYWQQPGMIGGKQLYGAELDSAAIAKVAKAGDEAARYDALAYLQTHRVPADEVWKSRYHGAAILSLVAGNPAPQSLATGSIGQQNNAKWPTLFVQFPSAEPLDTAGGWLGVRVFDGLQYVLDRAALSYIQPGDGEKPPVPVVACVSYGGLAGPHDGTSMLERAIIALLNANKHLRVVLPAGNGFDRGIHAVAVADNQNAATFRVFVPPDCPHPCFIEVWVPDNVQREITNINVMLQSPSGAAAISLKGPGAVTNADESAGIVLARRVAQGQNGTMILLAVQPTRVSGFVRPNVEPRGQAGVWVITVGGPKICCELHAWIERDDIAARVPRAQQARFVGKVRIPGNALSAEAVIDESSTFSSIANATHKRLYIVGAVCAMATTGPNSVSKYSASGPARAPGGRIGPDYSGRADAAPSLPGVNVYGVRSGDRYRSSGTSIAAAIVARHLLSTIYAGGTPPPAMGSRSPRVATLVP